jgi:hypothetical protein
MPTCRTVIAEALRACKAMAPGDEPDVDELNAGLQAICDITLELHEARGPLRNQDLPAPIWQPPECWPSWGPAGENLAPPSPPSPGAPCCIPYVANQNVRYRVQAGSTVDVTLPNSVPHYPARDPYDYGFWATQWLPAPGSIAPADGICLFDPDDGARIEIVAATSQLYLYRADLNQWMAGYGLDLMPNNGVVLDGEIALNSRYASALGALVAERLMEVLPDLDEPTPGLSRRIARGREALLLRPGVRRRAVRAEYF